LNFDEVFIAKLNINF